MGFWNEGAAQLVRATLENQGKRVEELAEALQLDVRAVRYWIRTKKPPKHPHVRNFSKLCRELGLSEDDFRSAAAAYDRETTGNQIPIVVPQTSIPAPESETVQPPPGQPVVEEPERRLLNIKAAWIAALSILAGIAALVILSSWDRDRRAVSSYSVPSFDENYEEAWAGKISPDGRFIAFNAENLEAGLPERRKQPPRQIFILSTEAGARATAIPGIEGVYITFFWDDSGRGLYVINDRKLMYVATDGGPPRGNTDVQGGTLGDANAAGDVVLGSRDGLIFVSPDGKVQRRESSVPHLFPTFLPDGERFFFLEQRRDQNGNATRDLYLMSLKNRTPRLIERNVPSRVKYDRGYLLYVRNCALLARPFDLASERLSPTEHKIRDDVWMEDVSGSASFSTSRDGVLVTQAPATVSALRVVLTARGIEREALPVDQVRSIALNLQRNELLLTRADRCKQTQTLWRWPLAGEAPQCLTCGRSSTTSPLLSPDSRSVLFASTRGEVMGIYSIPLNGQTDEKLVFASKDFPAPRGFSPDGSHLIIQTTVNRDGNLYMIPLGGSRLQMPAIVTPEMEGESARYSPDGAWLAFSAVRESESGVYILKAGDPPTEARLVGPRGWRCRWSIDGKKIYYAQRHAVMEYDMTRSTVRTLFEVDANVTEIAVAKDETFYVVTTRESHNRVDGDWTRVLRKPR